MPAERTKGVAQESPLGYTYSMTANKHPRGKYLQIGAGSRSRSQAKAEDQARRSRKRAEKRAAFRHESNA